jgi:hypothetical protein
MPGGKGGGIFAKCGGDFTVSWIFFTTISHHVAMTRINGFDNLHRIFIKSRRKVVNDLILEVSSNYQSCSWRQHTRLANSRIHRPSFLERVNIEVPREKHLHEFRMYVFQDLAIDSQGID